MRAKRSDQPHNTVTHNLADEGPDERAFNALATEETPTEVFEALLSEFVYGADVPDPRGSRSGWRKRWHAAIKAQASR